VQGLPFSGGRREAAGNRTYIPIEPALAWLRDNPPAGLPPLFLPDREAYVSRHEFAQHIGVAAFDYRWIKKGLLAQAPNGWVHLEKSKVALDAVQRRGSKHREAPTGFMRAADFRKTFERNSTFFTVWESKGLPRRTADGLIEVAPALSFLRERASPLMPPIWLDAWREFAAPGNFAKRVGIALPTVAAYRERGLPCAENGWIHIYRGLCWVRDNTKIKIPDSAWEGVTAPDEPTP
jgi:hypothetical protein